MKNFIEIMVQLFLLIGISSCCSQGNKPVNQSEKKKSDTVFLYQRPAYHFHDNSEYPDSDFGPV